MMCILNAGLSLVYKSWKFTIFSQNHTGYLKKYCTNTRLVCTNLNEVFKVNPKYGNKMWTLKIYKKLKYFNLSYILDICIKMVNCTYKVAFNIWERVEKT